MISCKTPPSHSGSFSTTTILQTVRIQIFQTTRPPRSGQPWGPPLQPGGGQVGAGPVEELLDLPAHVHVVVDRLGSVPLGGGAIFRQSVNLVETTFIILLPTFTLIYGRSNHGTLFQVLIVHAAVTQKIPLSCSICSIHTFFSHHDALFIHLL